MQVESILSFIQSKLGIKTIDIGIILGSGLGSFTSFLDKPSHLPYHDIPGFPQSTVEGHAGELVLAEHDGKKILCFSGRFHSYEGYNLHITTLPVQLFSLLQAKRMIVTNAAGGIRYGMHVGDLMLIRSTINIQGLASKNRVNPFCTGHFNKSEELFQIAYAKKVQISNGTYLFTKGPNYETPSEIRAFRTIGADAVGMSTYAELTEAEFLKLPYVAVSLITNLAAGMKNIKLDHSDIKDVASQREYDISSLFLEYIRSI